MCTIYDVVEEPRLCGERRPGVYLTSINNSVGDGVPVDDEAAGLIVLDAPIPIDPRYVPRRGFAYLFGESLLTSGRVFQIEADLAQAMAFCWRWFGLDWNARENAGVMYGITDPREALARMQARQWPSEDDRQEFLYHALDVQERVRRYRETFGDRQALPLIMASTQVYQAALSGQVPQSRLHNAGGALAATWRLIQAAQWTGEQRIERIAKSRLLFHVAGASEVNLATRYESEARPPDMVEWVGETFYPSPQAFIAEARQQGVSRRMSGVPKGLAVPWSRSFLVHPRCEFADGTEGPGVFGYYTVNQVQVVVDPDDVEFPAKYRLADVTPVRVTTEEEARALVR